MAGEGTERVAIENNILDRLEAVEAQMESITNGDVRSGALENMVEDGDLVGYRLIAVPDGAETTDPTSSSFSGSFIAGEEQELSDGSFWLARVISGLVQMGFGPQGIFTRIFADVINQYSDDGTSIRRGRYGMTALQGRTAPSSGMQYEDEAGSELVTNGGFDTLDMTGWTQEQQGLAATALGTLATGFSVRGLIWFNGDLYAAVTSGSTTSSVWRYSGGTWAAFGSLSTSFAPKCFLVVGNDLYVGGQSFTTSAVWVSVAGANFAAYGTLNPAWDVRTLALMGADIYAAGQLLTTSAVWKSTAGGAWAAYGTLSTAFVINTLLVIGSDIYAGGASMTTSAVWKSAAGGAWAAYGTLSPTSTFCNSLVASGADIYAGGGGFATSTVWRSVSGGAWAAYGTLSTTFSPSAILFVGTTLYAVIGSGASISKVWRIVSGGIWEPYSNFEANPATSTGFAIAQNNGDIYAADFSTTSSVWVSEVTTHTWDASNGYTEITVTDAPAEITSAARFAVTAGEILKVLASSYLSVPDGDATVTVRVRFYDALTGGNLISTDIVYIRVTDGVTPFYQASGVVNIPASATHAIISCLVEFTGTAVTARLDNISAVVIGLYNFLGFEPQTGKLVSKMLDGANALGQIPVGALSIPRVDEAKDKLAHTLTTGGAVDVGVHYYVTTFVDPYGETDTDLAQALTVTVANTTNDRVALTSIPIGKWGTTKRKIWRTKLGGVSTNPADYYLVTTINDNTTTTYNDDATDASLTDNSLPTINTTGSRPIFPRTAAIYGDEIISSVTMIYGVRASHNYGYDRQTQAAAANDGDEFYASFFLEAGSYTLHHYGVTASQRGKVDIYIDNVLVASGVDWYSAATTVDVEKTAAVTITESGYHRITFKINGKNASSSDFSFTLTKAWFTPAAY